MISINHIRTFLTIVEAGGLGAAAKRLHRSQPTLTAAIKQLETTTNITLFDRSSYRMTLTQSGEWFYAEAKLLMAEYEKFADKTKSIASGIETNINIDWDIALDFKTYVGIINQLLTDFPTTNIQLNNHHFTECKERLMRKETDLCLAVYDKSSPAIECFPLSKIKMVAVSSAKYIEDNRDKPLMNIMVQGTVDPLTQLGIDTLSEHEPRCLVKDMQASKQLILAGLGIGRLPEHLVREEIQSGELLALPPKQFSTVDFTVYCMRNREQPLGKFMSALWGKLTALSL